MSCRALPPPRPAPLCPALQVLQGDFPPNYRKYRHDSAAALLLDVVRWWIKEADIDGIRVDAARHMPQHFLTFLRDGVRDYAASLGKANFFVLTEICVTSHAPMVQWPAVATSSYNYPEYLATCKALQVKSNTQTIRMGLHGPMVLWSYRLIRSTKVA